MTDRTSMITASRSSVYETALMALSVHQLRRHGY